MLTYRTGSKAHRAGLDLVISLTPDQAAALGEDAALIGEAVDTVLAGLAALRTGPTQGYAPRPSLKDGRTDAQWQEWLIRDTAYLAGRLAGVQAAAVRSHADQDGTYGELAAAMDVSRSTAQRRRDAITGNSPDPAEQWATAAAPSTAATEDDDAGSVVNIATTGHHPYQAGNVYGDIHLHRPHP